MDVGPIAVFDTKDGTEAAATQQCGSPFYVVECDTYTEKLPDGGVYRGQRGGIVHGRVINAVRERLDRLPDARPLSIARLQEVSREMAAEAAGGATS